MTKFVLLYKKRRIEIEVGSLDGATVAELLEKASKATNLPPDQLNLISGGVVIGAPETLLVKQGLKPGSIILVIAKTQELDDDNSRIEGIATIRTQVFKQVEDEYKVFSSLDLDNEGAYRMFHYIQATIMQALHRYDKMNLADYPKARQKRKEAIIEFEDLAKEVDKVNGEYKKLQLNKR